MTRSKVPKLLLVGARDGTLSHQLRGRVRDILGDDPRAGPLLDGRNVEDVWRWLAAGPGTDANRTVVAVRFVQMAISANAMDLARRSLKALTSGEFPRFSLPLAALALSRQGAEKSDYLRLFLAYLIEAAFDFDRSGAQAIIASTAGAMLEEDVEERQVSKHFREVLKLKDIPELRPLFAYLRRQ